MQNGVTGSEGIICIEQDGYGYIRRSWLQPGYSEWEGGVIRGALLQIKNLKFFPIRSSIFLGPTISCLVGRGEDEAYQKMIQLLTPFNIKHSKAA